MRDLELTRTRSDRRLYALDGVGTLRLHGWMGRSATAEAGSRTWGFARRGLFRAVVEATDATGAAAGEFAANGLRRGGVLRWGARELELRPASMWRERYALADGAQELATFSAKGWGSRPVTVSVDGAAAVEPGLLLFAAFVVHGLAEDAGATAATTAGTAAAVAGS